MFYDRDDDPGFRIFFAGFPIAVGLVFLFMSFNARKPAPPPKNELVYGCYATANAPTIRLDANGMHIGQAGFPTVPFHIEWLKTGYALSADGPIQANPTPSFAYSFYSRGVGTYLKFYHVIDGKKYGIVDQAELQSFTMLASDGTYLPYTHVGSERCW